MHARLPPKPARPARQEPREPATASQPVAQRAALQPALAAAQIGPGRESIADYARSHASNAARTAIPPNRTGLPDGLKNGIEALSGISLADVRVHRNSPRPGAIQAHAHAQGSEIHLGPGQERHLPHETWHVVQQKQGRVRPTGRLEGGLPVNEDGGLEHEADVMGARALALRAPGPPLPPRGGAVPAGEAPVQGVWVKRKAGRGKDAPPGPWLPAKEGDDGAQDTWDMSIDERMAVRSDLNLMKATDRDGQNARKYLDEEIRLITGDIDEKEILDLGKPLAALQAAAAEGALDAENRRTLESISYTVARALSLVRERDDLDADSTKLQLVLESYVRQITAIDANALSEAIESAGSDVDLNVTAEDIAAYRGDIAERGTWGSGAEAQAIATAFNFRTRILILDSNQRYVQVDTLGPPGGAARNLALLNVGAHYQIVDQRAQAGGVFNNAHVVYNPRGDGDCLFRALHHVAANGAATVNDIAPPNAPLDEEAFVVRARAIASAGLGDPEITASIIEIRNSRSRAGLGPRLRARMNVQDLSTKDLRKQIQRTGKKDPDLLSGIKQEAKGTIFAGWARNFGTLEELLAKYETIRAELLEAPAEDADQAKRAKNLTNANALREILLGAIAKALPPVEQALVESEGQDTKLEAKLRRDSRDQLERSGVKVAASTHHPDQLVITQDGDEFVMDRIGQLVPRFVHRGISDFNIAELDEEDFMYPTGLSPIPDSKGSTYGAELRKQFGTEASKSASGISANKIKASKEMGHVEGVKPSPFLSTTAIAGGTKNPQGQTFGSTVRVIDLSYLPPSAIAATYTDRGMGYFLLSAFKGTAAEKSTLVEHATDYEKQQTGARELAKSKPSTKQFSADDAAALDARLSGKEWQALMDVIRTKEILISAAVPAAAIEDPAKK